MKPLSELRPKITIALFGEFRALNNEEAAMRDRVLDLILSDRKAWGEYVIGDSSYEIKPQIPGDRDTFLNNQEAIWKMELLEEQRQRNQGEKTDE